MKSIKKGENKHKIMRKEQSIRINQQCHLLNIEDIYLKI